MVKDKIKIFSISFAVIFLLVLSNTVAFADDPPSLSITLGSDSDDSDGCEIKDDEADPVGFNPQQEEETTIKFTTTCDLKITVNILDSDDKEVLALVEDVEKSADDYEYSWNGTTSNSSSGEYVDSGEYKYQIIGSDVDSGTEVDTVEGDINIVVWEEEEEVEEEEEEEDTDDDATLALQNTEEGTTSETGPGILIYGALPVLSIFYRRRKRSKN